MNVHQLSLPSSLLVIAALLSACGTSRGERVVSGSAIGAGVGAVGSTVTGGSTLGGAVVGGVLGGVIGGVTDKDDINLD